MDNCPVADRINIPVEMEFLVEPIAKEIHNSWVSWRRSLGFRYGAKADYEEKIHPHCLDWEELPPDHRDSDYLAAKAALSVIASEKAIETKKRHRVAATCGCYDVLHDGHISQLMACRALADEVIVFLNSDESIRSIKGDHKPVMSFQARVTLLRAVKYVDSIIVFHEDTPVEALGKFFMRRPDVGAGNFFWVKPAWDYARIGIPEREAVLQRGGIILYYDSPVPERSSSDIIKRIKEGISVLDF